MSFNPLSWLADHVFDPIAAAISRAKTSSNPVAAAVGAAADTAYTKITGDVSTAATTLVSTPISSQSAAALASPAIADAETGLQAVVDAFVVAMVGRVPVVGAVLAPEVVGAANIALTFGEQHFLTFISSLFNHAQTKVAALATPAPAAKPGE